MVLVQLDEHHRRRKEAHFSFDEDLGTDTGVLRGATEGRHESEDVARVHKVVLRALKESLR